MTSCLFRGSTNWEDKDNSFDDSFQGWISNYDDDAGVDDEDVDGEDEEEDDDDDNYNAFDDTLRWKEWQPVCWCNDYDDFDDAGVDDEDEEEEEDDDDNYNTFDDTPRWKSDDPSVWTVFKGE